MPIISYGIILPDGRFLPNSGDGHCKNAVRFCENFPNLNHMMRDATNLNPDEFLLTAGCAIVAGYCGKRCFKVAKNNSNPIIKSMIAAYQNEGFDLWMYWDINQCYKNELDNIVTNTPKMVLANKENLNEVRIYCRRSVLSQ